MHRLWLFSCFLIITVHVLRGQTLLQPMPVMGEPLGVKQGLSQGMINCIYQDKEGYLWISTKDGLNRYDGYNMVVFRNNTNEPYSLPDNYCNATLEDEKGNFWVGTNSKGLFLFDKATERFYPVPAINHNKKNWCIREMRYTGGKLYIQTWTDLIILATDQVDCKKESAIAGNKARLIFSYNKLQPNKKRTIENGLEVNASWIPEQSVWVAFPDSLFCMKPSADHSRWTISAYAPAALGIHEKIGGALFFYPVAGQPDMTIVTYNNTILHMNSKTMQTSRKAIPGQSTNLTDTKWYPVNDGRICNFRDSLINIYDPATAVLETTFVGDYKGSWKNFNQLYIDANGLKWFGTSGFGLIKKDIRKKSFTSYSTNSNTDIFWKLPLHMLPQIPEKAWNTIQFHFSHLTLDKKGVYWAYAENSELHSFNTQTNVAMKYPGLIQYKKVTSNIYNDPLDRLWIYHTEVSGKNIIARIDKKTGNPVSTWRIPDDLNTPDQFVLQFYLDEQGLLWLATINGLYTFNESNNTWKHWKNIPGNNNSLSSDKLLSICPDPVAPGKFLWIGTEGAGFNRFDKLTGHCIRYDQKDGLPNNVAYCILSDSMNNLWISTNNGLICFNPANKTFRNFTDEDCLPGNEFNRQTAMRMPNGELMFGGVDGFVIFNPRKVLQQQPAAPIVFTGFTIFNKPINWKTDSSNLLAPAGYAKTLTLLPGQNIFSIRYATLEFRKNSKKMYRHKLEGFDKDWTIPVSRNEVTYTNLSPGTYHFYVMGTNTDGVWSNKPISLKIIILPYWYQTLWFKILIFLLITGALYALYRYRLYQALKIEKLRYRIARDLHDEIGSTLSSISIYAESVKKVTGGNQKADSILSKINAGTTAMMEAMSDIVWAVNSRNDHFDDLANRMRSFAVQVTESKQIELQFTENKDLPDLQLNMEQRKNIYLICKEAISNAVKYSDCTLLTVSISNKDNMLIFHISDNGKGFDLNSLYRTDTGHSPGGNGLKNMSTRAKEINGKLEVSSQPGSGTRIILSAQVKSS